PRRRDQRRPLRLPLPRGEPRRAGAPAPRHAVGLGGARHGAGAGADLGARAPLGLSLPPALESGRARARDLDRLHGEQRPAAPRACERGIARLVSRWPALERRLHRAFQTFVTGLDGIRAPSHLLPLVVWSAVVWLTPMLAIWTMLVAMNLHLPWAAAWAVLAFVGLG